MESTGHEMTRTLHRSRFASYFRNAVVESQRVREASLVEEEVRCPQAHSLNSLDQTFLAMYESSKPTHDRQNQLPAASGPKHADPWLKLRMPSRRYSWAAKHGPSNTFL